MATVRSGFGIAPCSDVEAKARTHRFPRALILLSGAVRPTPFLLSIERSVLDLPIESGVSLLSDWQRQASEAAVACGQPRMEIRVVLDDAALAPQSAAPTGDGVFVERDPTELRGTGGIVRDLAQRFEPNDYLLIVGGPQLLARSLTKIVAELAECEGDIAVAAHEDGLPCSLMLVRCGAVLDLPEVGFVDMKEQGLPIIARKHRVLVRSYAQRIALPLMNEANYIAALRWHHSQQIGEFSAGAFDEEWDRRFTIVEPGATVHPGALIHDSVVLSSAVIGRNATIVRSVVCANSIIRKEAVITDALIGSARRGGAGL